MKPKRRMLIVVFSILLTFLVVGLSIVVYYHHFGVILGGVEMSEFTLNGDNASYSVNGGKAYRDGKLINPVTNLDLFNKVVSMVDFYKIEKEDPLFIGPEFDTKAYEASVLAFKKTNDTFISDMKFSGSFTPVDFLTSLIQLDARKRIFLQEPSEKTAQDLILSYRETQGKYQADAKRIYENMARLDNPAQDRVNMAYLGSQITVPIIMADYKLIIENGKVLENEVKKRQNILTGALDYGVQNMQVKGVFPKSTFDPTQLLPLNILNQFPEQAGKAYGPLVANTSCFEGKYQVPQSFYYYFAVRDGRTFLYPKLATNNLYENTAPGGAIPNWSLVKEGNPYKCNAIDYQVNVLNLGEFYNQTSAKDKKTIAGIYESSVSFTARDTLKKCKVAEAGFFDVKNVPTQSQLEYLGTCYGSLYYTLSTKQVETREKLLTMYLTLRDKSKDISYILNTQFILDQRVKEEQAGKTLGDEYFYLMNRNEYSITFFPFTTAVWRTPNQLQYVIPNSGVSSRTNDYRTLLKTSPSTLK